MGGGLGEDEDDDDAPGSLVSISWIRPEAFYVLIYMESNPG